MSSSSVSPYARVESEELRVNALKYIPEKDGMTYVGELYLGTDIQTEKEALRKLFFNFGSGKFAFTTGMDNGEKIRKLFHGELKDSDPYIHINVINYSFFEERGFKPLDYGKEGYTRIRKFPEEQGET